MFGNKKWYPVFAVDAWVCPVYWWLLSHVTEPNMIAEARSGVASNSWGSVGSLTSSRLRSVEVFVLVVMSEQASSSWIADPWSSDCILCLVLGLSCFSSGSLLSYWGLVLCPTT